MADFKRIIQRTTNSERVETGVADLQPNEICIVEDGEELIYKDKNGKYISVSKDKYKVNTIEDLKNSKKYKVRDVVEVLGYYSAGDGADHTRIISKTDNGSGVRLANGLYANLVHNGEVNVSWFGAKPIKEYDSTDIFIKLLGLDIKRITLGFKTYYLNLDLSDVVTNVRIDITDGFLKPFDRNVNKNYLLKMNNKANDFIFFPFRFKNVHLTGRENTNVDGEIDYIFYGVNTALLADDSIFSYAIKNNIYIKYGQYSKFNDCVFTCCVLDSEATSVVLDSNTSSSSANENIFMNCRFNTNRNHLKILGGISNKFYGNQFQYTTTGYAITLGADSTGFGANKCIFDSCYFEVNNKELKIGVGIGHSFVNNAFVDGIRGEVTFVQDYIFRDNQLYNGPNTLTITNSTQQTKRMIWEGNNFEANLIGMFNLDKLSSYSKPSTIGMNNWGDNIQRVETNTSITTSLEKVKIGAIPSGLKLNLVDLEISLISDSAASTTNSYFANSSYKYQLNINSNRVIIGEVYKYTQTSSFAEIKDVSITVESNEIFLNLTKSGTGVVGVIDKVICILNINEKFINKSIEWV
ncbi:hypothetical protein [Cetobacterium sp.]|uniref:hypothetical protein n=1 Tax=Cetobacterium sp. TaxID=2071632 RepID=UPI002FC87593